MGRKGENIYKRKDGRYEGRYLKGYDECGKRRWGYVYAKTYTEVKEMLNIKKYENKGNVLVVSVNMTLAEWTEKWISLQNQIKPTTRSMYYSHLNNHIKKSIGTISLKRLNADNLQIFVDKMTEKYAPKTVHSVFSLVKLALKAANQKGYVGKIYTDIKLPKVQKKIMRILTQAEQKRLEELVLKQERRYDIGILISLYTGLRIGELCALKWENIDFASKTINIVSTASRVKNYDRKIKSKTQVVFTEPKSISSVRVIPIPDFLIKILKKYKRENGFILTDDGRYLDSRTVVRRFKQLLKQAEIPELNYHILRHTFATRALELGFDVKTLSDILGHSNATITLNLYAHSLPEHQRREMNKFNNLFNNPSN